MGYCKHQWRDRSRVLREVFSHDHERRSHDFYVCERCLRIDEVGSPPLGAHGQRTEDELLAASAA